MVVIAPPVVYWVTLSISTFVANMLVTLFMYAAVRGVASKRMFGKSMAEILGFAFGMISKFIIAMIASLAALLMISPITLTELLLASTLSIIISLAVSFLASYREMRVSENKTRALISIMIFALLVGGLTFVSAYFSLQKQAIVGQAPAAALPDSQQLSAQKTDVSGELRPSAPSLSPSQSAAARVEDGEQDLAPPNPPAPSYTTLFVTPRSGELCIVSSASGIQEFRPKLECVAGEGFSQYRVYCPIEIAVGGAYTLSGSCS